MRLNRSRRGIGVGLISSVGGRRKKDNCWVQVCLFVCLIGVYAGFSLSSVGGEHQYVCMLINFSYTPSREPADRYLPFESVLSPEMTKIFIVFICGANGSCLPVEGFDWWLSFFYTCEREHLLFIVSL